MSLGLHKLRTTKSLRLLVLCAAACLFSPLALCQSTTVSGLVQDASVQTWNNGTYTFTFVPNPSYPASQYTWTGGAFSNTLSGTLSSSGTYSVSLPSNANITPQGSQWNLRVCPQASSPCYTTASFTANGTTQTFNAFPPAIQIDLLNPPGPSTLAYADSEIVGALIGSQYYNTTLATVRVCQASSNNNCTLWATIGTGGGGGGIGGSGTANDLAVFTAPQTIGNAPDFSDPPGAPAVVGPFSVTSANPTYGQQMQEATGSNCIVPAAGFDTLCANLTTLQLMLSNDNLPYAPILTGPVTDATASLSVKPPVGLVAISNLTLSGVQTIDGQLGVAGTTLVLAAAQSTASQNGPWVMQSGAWTRPAWYPSGGTTQAIQFATTSVGLGTTFKGSTWGLTTAAPITIDTTSTVWAQIPLALNVNSVTGALPHANIANTAVTPGSYTAANITVAPDGTITAAANGSGLPLSSTVNGMYDCGYTVTASVAVSPTCPQVGVGGRSIPGAATTDSVTFVDNATVIDHDQAATGAVNETLPTATTLVNPNFAYSYANHSAQNDTITPTTWTIQSGNSAPAASLTVPPGAFVRIKIDPNLATNWLADCTGCVAGSFTTLTVTANGAASTPALNMTGIPFAGTSTTSFPLVYLNNTGAAATTSLSTAGTVFGINAAAGIGEAIAVYNNGGPCTFCVSPAGAVTLAGALLPTGTVTSGGSVFSAAGSSMGFNGRSVFRSAADGRFAIDNNAIASNGLTRLTFGTEAANNPAFAFDGSTSTIKTADGTGATAAGIFSSALYKTDTNCSNAASPAVCGAAASGQVQIAASATSLQINTTAVTANSRIGCLTYSTVGITAPTNIASLIQPYISAISVGVSFTLTIPVAPLTNFVNLNYCIMN